MGRPCRLLLAVAFAAGCGHSAASGPAWPKASTADHDGGESLAPHESVQMATAIEKSDDDAKPAMAPAAIPAITPVIESGAGSIVTPSITAPVEETLTTEDIVIEIDD